MTEVTQKVNLLGMTREQLQTFFESLGEKKFRAEQVMKWIHHFGVDNFEEMTNIGKVLKARLNEVGEIRAPEVVSEEFSADGTAKWVVRVDSGSCVETVYIPVEDKRGTLCISSQAGCSLDCSFCSTGKQGFNSDLTAAEIIGQVWIAARALNSVPHKIDRKITNVVLMGMGEPLLNFDNVIDAISIGMDDLGYGISKRRMTLSTSGLVPQLRRLGEYTDCSLAISLHAPNDALRNELVPINQKYPLAELLDAVAQYMGGLKDRSRVVTIEYTLLAGVNDQPEHAEQMIKLLEHTPCKINLIPFNPFPHSGYERPSNNQVRRFQEMLQAANFNTTVRKTRGDDIDAACGQLVGKIQDRTRRSERYIAVRQLTDNNCSTPAS